MELGLGGKACIVTGASRGIGRAVADALAAEGADVVRVSRSEGLALDVTDPGAAERVLGECPRPWALVHTAGFSQTRTIDELSDADWQAQWELHVMAPMRLMRALTPRMAEGGGGRVVMVSSSSGKRPSGNLDAAYSVTKAAEVSLARYFADRCAADGVLVNSVLPGPVEGETWHGDGGLADQLAERNGTSRDEVLEGTRSRQPTGRMSTEDEVAAAIVFLCSERASNVAGAAWALDGGSVPTIF